MQTSIQFWPNSENNADKGLVSFLYATGKLEKKAAKVSGDNAPDMVKADNSTVEKIAFMDSGIYPCTFFGMNALMYIVKYPNSESIYFGRIVSVLDVDKISDVHSSFLSACAAQNVQF